MKAHKAKMQGNESPKAKMKENEGPKGQKVENGAGPGAAKFFVWDIGQTGYFWQLVGVAPEADHQNAKMQGNEGPQGQNARK